MFIVWTLSFNSREGLWFVFFSNIFPRFFAFFTVFFFIPNSLYPHFFTSPQKIRATKIRWQVMRYLGHFFWDHRRFRCQKWPKCSLEVLFGPISMGCYLLGLLLLFFVLIPLTVHFAIFEVPGLRPHFHAFFASPLSTDLESGERGKLEPAASAPAEEGGASGPHPHVWL